MAVVSDRISSKEARHHALRFIFANSYQSGSLRRVQRPCMSVTDNLYAIPSHILEALAKTDLRLLSQEELELERAFDTLCSTHEIIGVGAFGNLSFPLLMPNSMRSVTENPWATSEHIEAEQLGRETRDYFKQQELAYLGWLSTNSIHLKERTELKHNWLSSGANPAYLQGHRHLQQLCKHNGDTETYLGIDVKLANDFCQFYRRWDLGGLATWDLPKQLQPNLGGQAGISELQGISHNAAIQLPETMKFPTTLSIQKYLKQSPSEHLRNWRDMLDRNQTKQLAEGFVINFYQDIILKGIFGDDLHRCQWKLDQVLGNAFRTAAPISSMKGMNADSIKKVRQAYQRRG